ncbi:MAG TPA: lysylphosphatidylglycerol synthase transmembrane domain-containing protein, partial [Solirubrobacteraceae bacterium]|nr:lysylphosphatidylglycerol synthase transmembrane domain-containing protein [Solirubrobacteraceae bacterium]
MRSRRTSSTVKLATLAVTAGFSCLALHGVHLARAWHALERSDYAWLAPALLVLALAMGARALRWRSLFAPDRRPPLGAIANAMMLGYFYNNIMPARAGEVARVLVLSRRSRARPVEIAGTAALERVYDVVGVLVIFFLALPWLPRVSWL